MTSNLGKCDAIQALLAKIAAKKAEIAYLDQKGLALRSMNHTQVMLLYIALRGDKTTLIIRSRAAAAQPEKKEVEVKQEKTDPGRKQLLYILMCLQQ